MVAEEENVEKIIMLLHWSDKNVTLKTRVCYKPPVVYIPLTTNVEEVRLI